MELKRMGRSALRWAWRPRAGQRVPQYRGPGLIGNYFAFRESPLAVLEEMVRTCGEVSWIQLAHTELYLFNDPAAIRSILLEQDELFDRGDGSPDALLPHIGRNVLTTRGDEWRGERRAMRASLEDDMEARLVAAVGEFGRRRIHAVTHRGDRRPIDFARWTMSLTAQISLATFFDHAVGDDEADDFVDHFIGAQTLIFKHYIDGIPGFRHLPLPSNFRLNASMRRVWALAERVVDQNLRAPDLINPLARVLRAPAGASSGCPLHSLLGDPLEARRERAIEHVVGFLAAAPENPSNALTWGAYLLARHPEVLARLRAEVEAVLPGETLPTLADLPRLKYTRSVIQEVLRLFPGAWGFEREAMGEGVVEGYAVPRGALLFISPYLLHRNSRLWPEPERFDPDRFAHGPPRKGSYLPFGAGPRQCTGIRYAQLLLHLLLPLLVRDLDFSLVSARAPKPQPMFTLRVAGGLPMRLAERAYSSSSQMRPSSSAEAVTA